MGAIVGARNMRRLGRCVGGTAARVLLCRAPNPIRVSRPMMSTARDQRRPQPSVRFLNAPVPLQALTGDHSSFHARLTELEQMTTDIRERMAHVESGLLHLATKNDVTTLESTLLKWFIGTAIALTGLVFATARLMP
ncbi:hypothetical protein [Trinickia diaoshuihuensis]|jgi:hypothetical protein|uniref:hypothetical protein n=1 Tax=Trinickia diaoshuihuensis TaxID=2292265 RepID=UPI000E27E89E|nr:hypothetical protein [Trinickia diaoshuihuensis]